MEKTKEEILALREAFVKGAAVAVGGVNYAKEQAKAEYPLPKVPRVLTVKIKDSTYQYRLRNGVVMVSSNGDWEPVWFNKFLKPLSTANPESVCAALELMQRPFEDAPEE